jgi:hypothetical protein
MMTRQRCRARQRIEDDEVIAACRSLRLDQRETQGIMLRLASHRYILDLIRAQGGTATDFVRGRIEITRATGGSG